MKENNFKQTEIGLIPEDWKVVGLGEVCKITMGQSPPSSTYNDEGIGLPFLQGKAEFGEVYPRPVKHCSKPLKVAQEGDILISVRAPVGDVNIAPFKCAIGRGLASIRPLNTERLFIFYFLIYAKKRIEEEGTGSTFKAIRKNNLESFKIPLPSLPEQRKIARVLDKIQQAIEIQDKIIEQAKRLKKSLMQKLFTEGLYGEEQKETEIGLIPKSWEVVRLGEVCKITMGQSPPSSTYNDEGIGLPFLQGKAEFGEVYPRPVKHCSKPLKVAQEGDILISVRAPVGDVNIAPFKCAIGRGLASIRPLNTERLFIFYFLIYAKKRIEEEGTGSTFKAIRKNNLESFQLPLPSLEEQKQIAHILSTVDKKIEVEQKKKQVLKELFKTMLHKLMSGEIGLKEVEI